MHPLEANDTAETKDFLFLALGQRTVCHCSRSETHNPVSSLWVYPLNRSVSIGFFPNQKSRHAIVDLHDQSFRPVQNDREVSTLHLDPRRKVRQFRWTIRAAEVPLL